MYDLPPPRPRVKGIVERREEEERARAEAEARLQRKANRVVEKQVFMDGVALTGPQKQQVLLSTLDRAWDELRALRWPDWPSEDGNPFVAVRCCRQRAMLSV